ncbi:MAG: tRNA 5-methoxyuridine(34)/uridine 5-oxyacetic acid(34) synthase CmoB [Halieaceae bacterium]|uniref:tRNA 5-methoxyuridine(34)/uridine 5-oxyacetic acid(34) synthase CmoB n=1 Tax=Haliea alexandrii TaxID=2448162 RepID=UPI000F0B39D1|nr:tRNA 5-methoxyuridine(34)/uridine 5-oxyacetic acid(34) synthase CmoB [Haliea alexandrii]MCR9186060.1 tRNA 5-methoxyuridine(34)/uridine 5-oxyacetic acid(34) synthase CmoB [Halieaceae bacterium]
MIDYGPLIDRWQQDAQLAPWAERLHAQIASGLAVERYGDLPRWLEALAALPDITPTTRRLTSARVGADRQPALDEAQISALRDTLQRLHPWRKGPFDLFGVHIDTEWRSDWKWERLQHGLDDLTGRRVLDVGCGSGYHCWRMAGAGAREVIGIDPTPLFVVQYWALQKYLQHSGVWVLPLGIQHVPAKLQAFDSVFSMGVLYHRRSPMDHLQELRDCLRPGGQLILETLVIDGPLGATLVPEGRYARMGNVWFLPSPDTLVSWLRKLKFRDVALVDVSTTRVEEQRQTEWMRFQSLADFLDPEDATRTIEGYPAPMRAVVTARAP